MNLKQLLGYFYEKSGDRAVKQTGIFFSSQLLIAFLGYFIKVLQTRTLGPEDYGLYAFFGTLTAILVIFFNFGLFPSLQVLLAENKDHQRERRLIGLGVIISALLGIGFSGVLFILSFFIDNWFGIEFGSYLRVISILCAILPFRYLLQAVGVGTDNIIWFAFFDLFAKAWFLITLLIVWRFSEITLMWVLFLNMSGFFVSLLITWKILKPSFHQLTSELPALINKTKNYGLNYYWGFIANASTYKSDELFISYFVNTTQLGFYSLAAIICSPMVMLSQALSSSMFKKFAASRRIPPKLIVFNTVWLVFCVLFLYLFSGLITQILFGEEFSTVAKYIFPLSFAYFFTGLYQPYFFLAAKSQGKAIRNVAFTEAFINIAGNVIMIPVFGVMGAIYVSIFAKFIHFAGKVYYYRKYMDGEGE